MRFTQLHLENWRNFTHVDVALQERMFLIGANATGKSNLLDVFRFLGDLVRIKGGFQGAVADRGGITHLRSLVALGTPDIVIDVHMADGERETWRYRVAFAQDDQQRPIVREEEVWKSGVLVLDRPDERDSSDKELLSQTHIEQSSSNRAFREVVDFFKTIRYYHIVPQLLREPEPSARAVFDSYGRDFIAQLARLPAKTQQARLRLIEQALRAAVPQFIGLEVYRDASGFPHLRAKYEHWQSEGEWLTEADLSDGMLRLVGLLWALLDGSGPLLLEEPELSLHQDVVFYLPSLMGYNRTRQLLVSTQNVDLLRDEGILPGEVLILQPTKHGTKVVVAKEIETIKHLAEAGLSAADTTIPHTRPPKAVDLIYFRKAV